MVNRKQQKIRVLLADDHPFVREGVREHLVKQSDIEVIGEASDGEETIQKAKKLHPDILILDIRMPGVDGLAVARRLRKTVPATKIIAFTMYDNRKYVLDIVRSGARGYITKDAPASDLVGAIKAVNSGKTFFSPRILKVVVGDYVKHAGLVEKVSGGKLSRREGEVLSLIANGYTNKEIGRCFGVSPRTIEAHRAHIREKLGMDRTADLIKYAMANGIVQAE